MLRYLLIHYPKQLKYKKKLRKINKDYLDFKKLLDILKKTEITSHWIVYSG